jgi:hypothetical protein
MTHRIVFALLLSTFAAPVMAQDMFPNYWDRYAVKLTTERVPADSPTTSFYRNQYAVMTLEPALAPSSRPTIDNTPKRAPRDDFAARHEKRIDADCVCERGRE